MAPNTAHGQGIGCIYYPSSFLYHSQKKITKNFYLPKNILQKFYRNLFLILFFNFKSLDFTVILACSPFETGDRLENGVVNGVEYFDGGCIMCLPKHESMIGWAMNSNPWDSELRNYDSTGRWSKKHRHRGQWNGDKPEWRNQRKEERRFKELQLKILVEDENRMTTL